MTVPLSKIIELINTKNFTKAELELKKIYPNNSDNFDINKLLGVTLLAQSKYRPAMKCFEKCINQQEGDYDVNNNLSFIFSKIQFYKDAIKYGEKAVEIDSTKPQAYQNLAHCYFYLGQYEKAEQNSILSINARGGMLSQEFLDTKDLLALHADILLAQNKKEEFIKIAKEILNKSLHTALLIRLVRINPDLIEHDYIARIDDFLNSLLGIPNLIDRNQSISNTYFFLAEYFSKNNKTKSEEFYIKANQLISDMQRDSLFTRQKFANKIINYFKTEDIKAIEKNIEINKGDGLIFIFGMPRSGTTLTESIISTANNVQAGGEKVFFSLQLNSIIKNLPDDLSDLNLEYFQDLGDRYLDFIYPHRGNKKFFIDKLPENYLFYKFIRLALPGAKFIHCYRDPWDNAISLFKQNYSINLFYASSFFGIATEYANYEAIIKLWKKIDGPDAFLDIRYEEIVSDKSSFIQKIWDYCSLEGEYSEEIRKKHVGITASMQQVTKDIYQTSIKKADFIEFKETFENDLNTQRSYWDNKID